MPIVIARSASDEAIPDNEKLVRLPRFARNDKLGLSNNLREGTYAGTTAAELQDILRRAFAFEDTV
jgi:hypothetical protein